MYETTVYTPERIGLHPAWFQDAGDDSCYGENNSLQSNLKNKSLEFTQNDVDKNIMYIPSRKQQFCEPC